MKTFYFCDNESGEEFFVEATTRNEACKIAKEYFEAPRCFGTVSSYEAECMGLDTY